MTLTADVMFVTGLPFFVTLLGKIRLVTVEFVPKRKAGQLTKSIRKIVKLYARGGFDNHKTGGGVVQAGDHHGFCQL